MKLFIFGCEKNTSTDGVIYRGTTTILSRLYPEAEYSYLKEASRFYRDSTILSDEELLAGQKFDAIIFPGSPAIWDQYHKTPKIHNLLRAKQIHNCPVIWMGIGACLPLDHRDILYTEDHLKATKEIFGDDLVIVRDSLAKSIMDRAGVSSEHLACPSYWSQRVVNFGYNLPKIDDEHTELVPVEVKLSYLDNSIHSVPSPRKENLIVFYEPTIGLSHQSWTDPKKLEEYYDIFREFAKNGADVVVKDVEEVEFAEKIGLTDVRVLKDVDDTLDTVCKYKNVLSGRVHVGVPAAISGCNFGVIPIDTRYLTIPGHDVNTKSELDKIQKLGYNKETNSDRGEFNLEVDFEVYEKLIRGVLG